MGEPLAYFMIAGSRNRIPHFGLCETKKCIWHAISVVLSATVSIFQRSGGSGIEVNTWISPAATRFRFAMLYISISQCRCCYIFQKSFGRGLDVSACGIRSGLLGCGQAMLSGAVVPPSLSNPFRRGTVPTTLSQFLGAGLLVGTTDPASFISL